MDNVSRPLIALLVGTVAFFVLWMFALKPSSSSHNGSQGAGSLQSAIDKAHQAVGISNAASVAHGGTVVTGATTSAAPSTSAAASSTTTGVSTATSAAKAAATASVRNAAAAKHRVDVVTRALQAHRVLALLFYNPAATDDRAVKHELAAVPVHRGKVVKLAIPLSELTRYSVITNQVMVNQSPTLVVIDGRRQAGTIVGFADRFEISQRISDALAAG